MSILVLALAAGVAAASAQDADSFRSRLAAAKLQLGAVDTVLAQDTADVSALQDARSRLDTVRESLMTLQADLAGPRDASKARLQKLGDPPKPGDPPESPDVTDARKREQTLFSDLDGIGKEAQVQVVRTDQLANAVAERRRDAFTRQLTARSASILDPAFWTAVAADVPRFAWSLATVSRDAAGYFAGHLQVSSLAVLAAVLGIAFLAAVALRRRVAGWRAVLLARRSESRRFPAALDIFLGLLHAALGFPFASLTAVFALKIADLLPVLVLDNLGLRLAGAETVGVIYDAMSEGLLDADRPALRLLPLSDWAVRRIRRRTRWIALVLGLYSAALSLGRAMFAPISLTVAVTAVASLLFALIATSLLMRLRRAPAGTDADGRPLDDDINPLDMLRPILWIVVVAVFGCLLAGYVALAGFIAFFPLVVLFTAAFAYTLMVLVDAALTEGLAGSTERSRAVAGAIGVSAKNVAFVATLASGLLRLLVLLAALLFVAAPLGFYSSDMLSGVERSFFGFQVGEITVSPSSILLGAILFTVLLAATRAIRSWVRNALLPRTRLDAGLQNSIATIVGYAGAVLAIAVGLSEIGLSLQNVAIVAGALSVGIGFGLQSIVSNFVSGLILLAERPIRVGDIIAAGGEEGFVRRISVRATEVETYDRATLIIPNSALITGTVKNWVYGNTWSRVRVTVHVGYDVDVEVVRAAMRSAAEDDPRVLPTPPPRVFLANLGAAALEFELVVVVASVETMPAVRSDLHIRILKAFREKGIRMQAELPAAPAPVVVTLAEAMTAAAAADLHRRTGEAADAPGDEAAGKTTGAPS